MSGINIKPIVIEKNIKTEIENLLNLGAQKRDECYSFLLQEIMKEVGV